MNIKRNIPLKNLTTFRVGGPANYFCKVKSTGDLKKAINFSRQNNLVVFVLGGGSNILISDSGFDGLVIKIELKGILYENTFVRVGAGESWDDFIKSAIDMKLYGIENLSFIPGTVGGAISGNIGAYGMEVKDKIQWVEVFDIKTSNIIILKKSQCKFAYRDSIFKKPEGKNYIITKVCFKLTYNGKSNLSYKDVKEYFKRKNNTTPTIGEVRKAIGSIRKGKFPNLNKFGTAGSFFKNPVTRGNKIYLAGLLDGLGMKGLKKGNVGLYENQPLVFINYGSASAKEIKNLSEKIINIIKKETKIKIIPEVIFVGNF
ncbi:MAG: UDP-N-acetylmuramate dehydrogenase [Candidatus Pacebacteria bacterium]|jgi:UDP-N-acetylmuramate dehydrogenase|nr:UDP-N-acetylmuramate dehydrogenase [Candidatus Paceibacterota bacterium]|tara:strand:- start:5178 stop:6125 length:948 start_codon:yes stop_codon:yes gene_type:complete